MDPKKIELQPQRVGGAGKIKILNATHLDPEYETLCLSDLKATETGLVKLIEIRPREDKTLPSFVLRWDRNYDTVDVDIYLQSKNRKDLWKKTGYFGHHTIRIKDRRFRRFDVDIKIPNRSIFKGLVEIGLFKEVNLELGIEHVGDGKFRLTSNLPFPNLPPIKI